MKYQQVMQQLATNSAFLIADAEMNAFSYPVPCEAGGAVLDAVFLFSPAPRTVKTRPHAALYTHPETGAVQAFCLCAVQDFAADTGVALGQAIDYAAPMKDADITLSAAKKRYLALYEEVRLCAFGADLTAEQQRTLRAFRDVFALVISEQAAPFYLALSPRFFAWMEETLK